MNIQLITKNNVQFNTGRVTGSLSGKVLMTIHGANRVWKNKVHTVEVDYSYTSTIEGITYNLKREGFLLNEDFVNALSAAIAPSIPVGLTDCELWAFKVTAGAKIKFAETFGISPNDIEEYIAPPIN